MFRLTGIIIGFALGGLLGALEGFCMGYLIDYLINRIATKTKIKTPPHENTSWENYNTTQNEYQSTCDEFSTHDTLTEDYKILGIPPDANDEEVKNAYRSVARKNHPDKFNYLGEKARKIAEEKFAGINNAYERIKKSRKIK